MLITVVTISIVGITALVWLGNRAVFLRYRSGRIFQVCPICAGVFGTWVWLLVLYFAGYPISGVVPALLMGGSVVGIAYQFAPSGARPVAGLEKKLFTPGETGAGKPVEFVGWRTPLLFKTFFIPVGFIAAYSVLAEMWSVFFVALIVLLQLLLIFRLPRSKKVVHPVRTPPPPVGGDGRNSRWGYDAPAGRSRSARSNGVHPEAVKELEKKMKNCC